MVGSQNNVWSGEPIRIGEGRSHRKKMPDANGGTSEKIGTSGWSKHPPSIGKGDRSTHARRQYKGGEIVCSSSEEKATVTKY